MWAGSDSEGTSPSDLCGILDAGLQWSSHVVWKVSLDMLLLVRLCYDCTLDWLDFEKQSVPDRFKEVYLGS